MMSLYVHIPFCKQKCFYCSFAVTVGQIGRAREYVRALLEEAQLYRGAALQSMYIGGGTPSTLEAEEICFLLKGLRAVFSVVPGAEVTMEVNPESFSVEKAAAMHASGVTRISLGVQTFSDGHLHRIGRAHSSGQARQAFAWARAAGYDNISVDLMFSLPGQSLEEIRRDVDAVLDLQPDHVSLYQLNIEPQSRFYTRKILAADESDQVRHYHAVCSRLTSAGLMQYEVSNFARPGRTSVHNCHYWCGGNYIGLGMAAHAHINGRRSWNVRSLSLYMHLIEKGQPPEEGHEILSVQQRLMETVCLGLRTNDGIDVPEAERRFHAAVPEDKKRLLASFVDEGLLKQTGTCLQPTRKGLLLSDGMAERLMPPI